MKKILILIFICFNIFAQDSTKITIDKKDLPPDVVKKIEEVQSKKQEVQQTQKTVESVGQWVNLGKEIGLAMDQGLKSVTQTAVDLSNSPLGWYIMTMIAWKVLGKELMAAMMGFPFTVLMLGILVWSYRRTCITRRILKYKKWNEVGKKYDYEWEIVSPKDEYKDSYGHLADRLAAIRLLHMALFVIILVVSSIVIF